MTGKVKAQHRRAEKAHFLRNPGLDLIISAAAKTVNAQNHPADRTGGRGGLFTGYLQLIPVQHNISFHISPP